MNISRLKIPLCALATAFIAFIALTLPAQTPAGTPKPTWEVVSMNDRQPEPSAAVPELLVTVHEGGKVLITTDRPTTVQIFSILGQLITQKQINAGTVRLTMGVRGIYILKADNTTRRISL